MESPFVHYLGFAPGVIEAQTVTLASAAPGDEVSGFAGPIRLLLGVGRDGVLRGVRYLESGETPSYIAGIDAWLAGLRGADLGEGPLSLDRLDGLSGATVTSRAALETINRAARRGTEVSFGVGVPQAQVQAGGPDWGLYATALLLLLFFPVYFSGSEVARLFYQAGALAILGFWLNTLITEVDLANLSQGLAATPAENPQRWLLLGFAAVTGILFGQVWCGYLCPFGALQEFVSRLGHWLGLRSYPDRPLEQRMRYIKYILFTDCVYYFICEWRSHLDHLRPDAACLRGTPVGVDARVDLRGPDRGLVLLPLLVSLLLSHGGLSGPGQ